MRSTIFFGNGLGMAIDPAHFRLKSGIEYAIREDSFGFRAGEIEAIKKCIFYGSKGRPIQENDLGRMHEVSDACLTVKGVTPASDLYLTSLGQRFHKAVNNFNFRVAHHFFEFDNENEEFEKFYGSLKDYLDATKSHIVTLNYDSLLYRKMIEDGTLSGFSGTLIDGFTRNGGNDLTFNDSNLNRYNPAQLGFYLHLHGSPLFYSLDNGVAKRELTDVWNNSHHRHLVLTHVDRKMGVISNSQVLSKYWARFTEALRESTELIVLGYGGGDFHVNQLIKLAFKDGGRVRVVEREAEGMYEEREKFWKGQLGEKTELIQQKTILAFDNW